MSKLTLVVLGGMLMGSAVAFADAVPNDKKEIDFKCHFSHRAAGPLETDHPRCWVEGTACIKKHDRPAYECREEIEIKCDNGFKLKERNIAVAKENDNLWINAKEWEKIATLLIKDIHDRDMEPGDALDSEHRASLLISPFRGKSARIDGECKVKKHDR